MSRQPTLRDVLDTFLTGGRTENQSSIISEYLESLRQQEHSPEMMEALVRAILDPNGAPLHDENKGIDDDLLDTFERVKISSIPKDKCCPICTNEFHQEEYPLIVQLPCNPKHYFDLDCIGPWLKLNRTCPLCRVDVTQKKKIEISDSEEEQDLMYG
ncbi:hypothetical protein KL930_005308 [Ogataea haglerorum]|uniref:RING-type domain-containing protein n=1 Tax=Ogataea haglerorum TaxID=1937702 RepID=A0AAN6HXW2_9ASCO|nr:uncharacterized protein KL911_004705 [Ogataea haglerorum]KAG7691392.1 hypothetical protein KL915_005288 [Ogataea haglerorum]KAG7691831.1 hypothetical protein KL951_005279 [Ogataea haglerorum]KAG7702226.1 hypothetical protein KL914_005357 [Ogataea haglerorum]KAG7702256.1 hypothetical protein KL950_005306 [Ogataea haglerorum]KAG7713036.1 hypothetical protein KL949_005330 [Ogataea haglerorum]